MTALSTTDPGSGWQARLALRFCHSADRTLLGGCEHRGPLRVQRPFYPEPGGACHLYVLHPPGGVVGGDSLSVGVNCESDTEVLITTPAAGKFYRSAGPIARLVHHLRVAGGASLEWFPQENIAFAGARVRASTRVELSGDARFIGWEILCLGRPASGETFAKGAFRQELEIWRDGSPLYLEPGRFESGSELLEAAWGLQGRPVTATLVCVGGENGLCDTVRSAVGQVESDELFGVSQLDGILLCRYLGASAQRAFDIFLRAWSVLRPLVLNKPAIAPRIWFT